MLVGAQFSNPSSISKYWIITFNSYNNPILQLWKLRHEVATRLTSDSMAAQEVQLEFDSMSGPKAFF